ncbi:MAG: SusF/SusE family outer membrane protein [Bacteroidales bacterium]|nr:SusF/SusE family outer membrane protein [Bacteroidales bacterium]
MKNIFKISALCLLPLVFVISCNKVEDRITVPDPSTWTVPVLQPFDTVGVTKSSVANGTMVFRYNLVDCGQPKVLLQYSIYAKKGDLKPVKIGSSYSDSVEVSYKAINTAFHSIGVPVGEWSEMDFYVRVSVGSGISEVGKNSESIRAIVTAISLIPEPVYLVGNIFGAPEWSIDNPLFIFFRDEEYAVGNVYSGYCNAGEFKVVEGALGDWNSAGVYGKDDEGKLTHPGNNISIAAAGYYTITVNTGEMTYSVAAFGSPNETEYTSVSIIGDGIGGWEAANDIIMDATSYDSHIYTKDNVTINGEVKFRVNQDWTVNWGGTTFPYGLGSPGGDNINVPDGTYFVKINTHTGHYMFIGKD